MKCAESNTWLSFVTATRKCLPSDNASPPTALEQDDADCGAGQIGGGAGVLRVAFVSQGAVESGDRPSARRGGVPPRGYHLARPPPHPRPPPRAASARGVGAVPRRGPRVGR